MFYETRQQRYERVTKHDLLIVLGDVKAEVGQEEKFEGAVGKHGLHVITIQTEKEYAS